MSHFLAFRSIPRKAPTITALLVAAQALLACASTPHAPQNVAAPACRASQVSYCSANGGRSKEDICVCLDQSAAKATVDSL